MAPLSSMIDLTKLRPGVKVRLGGQKDGPVKPYPKGWVEVVELDGPHDIDGWIIWDVRDIRVVGDDRWVPVRLIEEIREP